MQKLAILGTSYLQQPLVEKAKQMGIETHCFSWDNELAVCKTIADYFYPISVLEKQKIFDKCKEIGIHGITTVATDICVPSIAYVAEKMNLISNSYDTAIAATNKEKMRTAFQKYGVNSPQFHCIDSNKSYKNINLDFPLIVKPTDQSGSRGVSKVCTEIELKIAVQRALHESIEKKVIIEEFIEGLEVSVETISWKGNHYIIAITDKVTSGEPYYVELEHHQPSSLPSNIQELIKYETVKALNALKIEFGASHSEFKITNEGRVYAIEVGARMGGDFIGSHLVQLSTGYDFLKGVIEVALGEFKEPIINTNFHTGVYFLSKETEHHLKYFSNTNKFDFLKKCFQGELKNIKESNDRSGFLIYSATNKIIL